MKEDLFLARVEDVYNLCIRTSVPHFLGFLTLEERSNAESFLKKFNAKYAFKGGFDEAERTVLCCFPDWCDSADFPFTAVTFEFNKNYSLSHRDFLGSLMALGITRESVGDILVESGRAVVFVKEEIKDFILTQIEKIGRVGVTLKTGYRLPLPNMGELVSCTDTVSSMRIDCVVSAVCGVSRCTATELIEDSKVLVNSIILEKASKIVTDGDAVTVRGKGKYFIDSSKEFSKKGRIILKYSKYV